MNTQELRRAIGDMVRFNPKDFLSQGSATGVLVSLLRTPITQEPESTYESFFNVLHPLESSSVVVGATAVATDAALVTAQATVDASMTANYDASLAGGFWFFVGNVGPLPAVLESGFVFEENFGFKRVRRAHLSDGTFSAGAFGRRMGYQVSAFSFVNAVVSFSIQLIRRETYVEGALPPVITESVIWSGESAQTLTGGVDGYVVLAIPNLVSEVWPVFAYPTVAGAPVNVLDIEYVVRINSITYTPTA